MLQYIPDENSHGLGTQRNITLQKNVPTTQPTILG